jgi:hypothetical protein
MSVTQTPKELVAAADRAKAMGDHAYASHLYNMAWMNAGAAPAIQEASMPRLSPALVGPWTSALQTARAAYATSRNTAIDASHVRKNTGQDGRVLSSGPVS